ncbi:DUF2231 domain-containing protein [Cellvibrio sp. ARAG 10.3]|uniref:DUF2231 domain-containing protein n=1 Tax=Cellvibrio sp. ARAG 10.3 TaxID=3451358 RepID=UPI003F4601B6
MTVNDGRLFYMRLHPVHGVLLAGTIPLFLGSVLSDLAYTSSYHIQWSNFASWFITGGLVFGGFALLGAIIHLARTKSRNRYSLLYTLLLLATWILGFFNAFIHAKDAWATMPTGLILSIIVMLLACASTWIGFAKFGVGGGR